MKKSNELRERRAALAAEAQALLGPNMSAEQREKYDRIMSDVDLLASDVERCERAERLDAELRQTTRPPLAQPGEATNTTHDEARQVEARKAFRNYLTCKHAEVGSRAAELRTYSPLAEGVGSSGGYFAPQGFQYEIETALKAFGGMREVARILPTSTGNPLPWPTSNDTGTVGELVGENQAVSFSNATIGHQMLGAYKYSTKAVQVSLELLQDSAFDIEAYLKEQFVIRLGRITNSHFTVGDGSAKPNGIVPAAYNGGAGAGATIGTGGAISYADLVNLEHSVDPAYRKNAKFMFADSTLKTIKLLTDTLGRPLWQAGVAGNSPDTILGHAYQINQDMPALPASGTVANFALFGDFSKYIIRSVKELSVLRLDERYAELGQVAFIGFARYDGQLIDAGTHPVATLASK
jgi:HK97 family phage major capsid protein